ncbi:hypothetical protein GOBAR_AA18538 [Gossypium barbadense]|uniref:Uncharacterized protein n=1 Tax=Gossypium barbadense TaxID=3634 RepID=A0A2P5XFK5_GOSBA|nr:hypothetical protein GOBAR_AA18538 [Gossypium barbadense]
MVRSVALKVAAPNQWAALDSRKTPSLRVPLQFWSGTKAYSDSRRGREYPLIEDPSQRPHLASSLAQYMFTVGSWSSFTLSTVCFTYIEEHVNDGPETSNFLQSIVEDYQLIIVGRRYKTKDPQTSGLQEWCEFQEIGIIGDLLSSADFIRNYSLLIVQQQQQRTV